MEVAVIGCGYVGLTTAACLADSGHAVYAVEENPDYLAILRSKKSHISEPKLEKIIFNQVSSGRLVFTDNLKDALEHSAVCLVCVGTPSNPDGSLDTSGILNVLNDIASIKLTPRIVAIKSTCNPGTADAYAALFPAFNLAVCPEFLREGHAVEDFKRPHRVVIGTDGNEETSSILRILLTNDPLNLVCPVVLTNRITAEIIKLSSNAILAAKISISNCLADITRGFRANLADVIGAVELDPRIGKLPDHGIGYGGPCLPKDVRALIHSAQQIHRDTSIFSASTNANLTPVKRIIDAIGSVTNFSGVNITILGVSAKPDSADVRGSKALALADYLADLGAKITLTDPYTLPESLDRVSRVKFCGSFHESTQGADIVILAVPHTYYVRGAHVTRFRLLRQRMAKNFFVDPWDAWDPASTLSAGLCRLPL